MVKNLPAMQETQETQVQSLGWEYPLEEENATHSSILARKIPWIEQPGGLQSMGSQRLRHDLATEQQQVLGIQWQIKQDPCPSGANSPTAQTGSSSAV